MRESIWEQTAEKKERAPLPESGAAEAVVIGGGMAGILIAWYLREAGVDAVVLEAERVGSGQTRNTTAKVTSQHGAVYQKLVPAFGEEGARLYANANETAIEAYEDLIQRLQIDCDWQRLPAILYSSADSRKIEAERDAAVMAGIPASHLRKTELPFPVKRALSFPGQARFHPLKFLYRLAEEVPVYEQTRVLKVEDDRVQTNRGWFSARHIIFATHYPFVNAPGYYFMRMHQERSYVLALRNTPELEGLYYGVDPGGVSLRNGEGCLLLGGGNHRAGENTSGGRYELLRRTAQTYWPQAQEAARWSAQDCMTLDDVPYIGRFSASTPHWYVATGFGKWGMSTSMVSALLLRDLILGKKNPWEGLFTPQRLKLSASAKRLVEDSLQAVKGISREALGLPRAQVEELPLGHGGIVDWQGEKLGVYKNQEGEAFVVSARCPHLGCQLEWNPDEKSWDCPCHGSRFDYLGHLLDGPAQENLLT